MRNTRWISKHALRAGAPQPRPETILFFFCFSFRYFFIHNIFFFFGCIKSVRCLRAKISKSFRKMIARISNEYNECWRWARRATKHNNNNNKDLNTRQHRTQWWWYKMKRDFVSNEMTKSKEAKRKKNIKSNPLVGGKIHSWEATRARSQWIWPWFGGVTVAPNHTICQWDQFATECIDRYMDLEVAHAAVESVHVWVFSFVYFGASNAICSRFCFRSPMSNINK